MWTFKAYLSRRLVPNGLNQQSQSTVVESIDGGGLSCKLSSVLQRMAPKKRKRVVEHPPTLAPARWPCPACHKDVPAFFINSHLDMECSALRQSVEPPRRQDRDQSESSMSASVSAGPAPSLDALESGVLPIGEKISNSSAENGCTLSTPLASDKVETRELQEPDADLAMLDGIFDGGSFSEEEEGFGEWTRPVQLSRQWSRKDLSGCGYEDHDELQNDRSRKSNFSINATSAHASIQSSQELKDLEGIGERNCHSVLLKSSCSPLAETQIAFRSPVRLKAPHGLQVIENFITAEEEEQLLHCLDMDVNNPWKDSRVNGFHAGKSYGNHIFGDQNRRVVKQVSSPMPKFILPIAERMRDQVPGLKDFFPNEMNSIDYRKADGHYLKSHMDDRQLSGTTLVNLSMAGCCFMTYTRERGLQEAFRVKLPPRSLQILTGQSRYNYTHGIQKNDLVDPRRVSMTFRQSVDSSKNVRPTR